MSGVTDMDGYRQALNLSYHELGGANDTKSCDAEDDSKTAAILVKSQTHSAASELACV